MPPQVPRGCSCGQDHLPMVACDGTEGEESLQVHVCNTDPIPVEIENVTIDITEPITVEGAVDIGNLPLVDCEGNEAVRSAICGVVDVSGSTVSVDQPITVTGTVNIGTIPEVEVKNDAGNPLPVSGTVTANAGTGPWPVTDDGGSLTVDGIVATNAEKAEDSPHVSTDIGNFVLAVRNDAAIALTSLDGDYSPFAVDSAGRMGITDLGGSITVDGSLTISSTPSITGGLSVYRNLDVNATGQVIKGSVGQVYNISVTNRGNQERFLKLYNKATAPTNADTPLMTIPLGGVAGNSINVHDIVTDIGFAFPLGIGIRATTGLIDGDNVNPGANEVVAVIGYK